MCVIYQGYQEAENEPLPPADPLPADPHARFLPNSSQLLSCGSPGIISFTIGSPSLPGGPTPVPARNHCICSSLPPPQPRTSLHIQTPLPFPHQSPQKVLLSVAEDCLVDWG